MNATDIALIVLGGYFVVRGLLKGLSGELLSLISVVGGFYCALAFYVRMAKIFSRVLDIPPLVATTLSMAAIFILIYVATSLAGRFARELLRATHLAWMDKLAGGAAGLVKLYLIALFLLVAGMILAPVTGDSWARQSEVLRITAKTWPTVYPLLDRMGVLPNVESLQKEAASYIREQAMPKADFARPEPSAPRAGDRLSKDTSGKYDDRSDVELSGQNILDFFLSFGKKKRERGHRRITLMALSIFFILF